MFADRVGLRVIFKAGIVSLRHLLSLRAISPAIYLRQGKGCLRWVLGLTVWLPSRLVPGPCFVVRHPCMASVFLCGWYSGATVFKGLRMLFSTTEFQRRFKK